MSSENNLNKPEDVKQLVFLSFNHENFIFWSSAVAWF
jgi:hypothetical protein